MKPYEDAPIGQTCYVAGWGALTQGGDGPANLNSVNVEIYSDATCSSTGVYSSTFDPDNEICAGQFEGMMKSITFFRDDFSIEV